jgi:hypothetical protein
VQKLGVLGSCLRTVRTLPFNGPAGDQIHFQIISGRLYVDYQTNNKKMPGVKTRNTEGWFPGTLGAGEPNSAGTELR